MKALVLAGGIPQIELIKELKRRGYFTILADYTEHPVAEKYADKFYRKSTLDIDAIRRIAVDESVDLVITCCTDQALNTVAAISEALNLPCYVNEKTGLAVTNKQYMKKIFLENRIPTARFHIISDAYEERKIEYPLVVKPVDCNSSKGVVKVFNDEQYNEAIKAALGFSRTNRAIIEEYITGEEVSVDLFVVEGKAEVLCTSFSEKIKDDHKFVIYKGQYPAKISDTALKKIESAAQGIAEAFKLNNCPMLMQVLIKDDDIYVVEFSARTGGCIKYRMIELASGVDVIKATVDLFEKKIPNILVNKSNKYVVDEFIYCKQGVYDHVLGIEECINNGWIREAYILKEPGTAFDFVNSSGDRIAAIVYVADSYSDYIEYHNNVINTIRIIDVNGQDMMRYDLLPAIEKGDKEKYA